MHLLPIDEHDVISMMSWACIVLFRDMAATDTDHNRWYKGNSIFFTTSAAIGPFIDEGYTALQR